MGLFSPQLLTSSPLHNTQDHIYKAIEKFLTSPDSISLYHYPFGNSSDDVSMKLQGLYCMGGQTRTAVVIEYVLLNWIPYLSHSHAQPSGAAACSSRASSAPVSLSQLDR